VIKELKDRYIDDIGRVIMTTDGLIDMLMKQQSIEGLLVEECDDTLKYNTNIDNNKQLEIYSDEKANETPDIYDSIATTRWKTPEKYQIADDALVTWLFEKCKSENEYNRVLMELEMFDDRGLYPLLKHLIFLVDHFRKNNIVWGIGRGSSVSSYILFLIGIHRVNSIDFNLNINDFLK